jgi:hypothetical protein
MDEAKIAELQEKHGDLAIARPKGLGMVICKTPEQDVWERFQEKVSTETKGSSKATAHREFVLSSLVYPSRDDAIAIFRKKPALIIQLANNLADMAGADEEIEVKKA